MRREHPIAIVTDSAVEYVWKPYVLSRGSLLLLLLLFEDETWSTAVHNNNTTKQLDSKI